MDFMRKCPSCGRRLIVRHTSKKLIGSERDAERILHDIVVVNRGGMTSSGSVWASANAMTVEEVPIEREEFEVSYECRHCHHKWSETFTKVSRGM
ncbi:MAG: hypothetical protein LYZ69_04965 [Nitrososphaerales archaeon]|nr:hypothetical protein [Nitrososphaerales archaeon]